MLSPSHQGQTQMKKRLLHSDLTLFLNRLTFHFFKLKVDDLEFKGLPTEKPVNSMQNLTTAIYGLFYTLTISMTTSGVSVSCFDIYSGQYHFKYFMPTLLPVISFRQEHNFSFTLAFTPPPACAPSFFSHAFQRRLFHGSVGPSQTHTSRQAPLLYWQSSMSFFIHAECSGLRSLTQIPALNYFSLQMRCCLKIFYHKSSTR